MTEQHYYSIIGNKWQIPWQMRKACFMGQAHEWFLPARLCNLLAGSDSQAFALTKGSPADQPGILHPLSCLLKPLMTLCLARPAPSPLCHIQFVWRIFSSWLLMLVFSCRKTCLFSHQSRLDSPVLMNTCIRWWLVSPRNLIHSVLFQKTLKVFFWSLYPSGSFYVILVFRLRKESGSD